MSTINYCELVQVNSSILLLSHILIEHIPCDNPSTYMNSFKISNNSRRPGMLLLGLKRD